MSISWPLVEPEGVAGWSLNGAQTISWPFIDSGGVTPPTVRPEGPADVEVLVGGTVLDGVFGLSFEEQLDDTGSFQFSLLRSDFLASTIAFDDEVLIRVEGVPRFGGVVEDLSHQALASGEESDQIVRVSGRGTLALLDQHVVYPSRGLGALPIEDVRSFSWVGADFDPADAGWPFAKVVNLQRSYADTGAPRPDIHPNINGKWIWANRAGVTAYDAPQGINLFRKTITLDDTRTCRFFYAGDNVMRLWIDGAEITWFAGSRVGRYTEIELGAGDHIIAAKVANKVDVPGEDNPAGFILDGYTVNNLGLLDERIVSTSTTWRVLAYPVRAPGFTVGKVLRLLFDEVGLLDDGWTLGFTDTRDSAGKPWTYQREIAVNVGRTLLEAVREMMDVHADVAVAPGTKKLQAWNRGTRGRVRSVTLQQTTDPATSDFLDLRHEGKRTRATKVLIRYGEGHTQVGSGSPVQYLEVGHITDEQMAKDYASALMENRAGPSFSTSATLHPHNASATPYRGFGVGDWIECPNEDDDDESMRVRSIAYSQDDDGIVDWPITLRDVRMETEERQAVQLRRMADGTMVGGARVASRAGTPAPTAQQVNALQVAEFSHDNSQLTVSRSPRRPAEQSGNIVQIYGELTTAGSTTTAVEVYKGATLITTLNFGPGETEDWKAVNIVPVLANVDKLQTRITVAGTGAEGLDVQVRAV